MLPFSRLAAAFLLIFVVVLSPLRAVAATMPTLIDYDAEGGLPAALRSATGPSRPAEWCGIPEYVYDDTADGHDGLTKRGAADSIGAVHAYDGALELSRGREVAEGAVYGAPAAARAAEGGGSFLGGLVADASGALRLTPKAINLPSWRTVGVDMAHIVERHLAGGPLTAGRTVFPSYMGEKAAESAIRQAYRFGSRIGGQGERVLVQGQAQGLTIEIWLNKATKMIETAYPVF